MRAWPTTLVQQRDAIRQRAVSSLELTTRALHEAERLQPRLNAMIDILPDSALSEARAIDARLDKRDPTLGPLAGVPIVIKDNICLSTGRTTCASRFLEGYRSPYDATAAQRVRQAGAIVIGKANLDEFAMGSSGERSFFGPARNPWDPSRVPGGSSSGSAVVVSAGIVAGSLGSDTGGSIRMPAGMCNLVGFKPSYGRVSRFGLVAYASSLDQIGPFARTVEDAASLAQVIVGEDPRDATTLAGPAPDLLSELSTPIAHPVIGIPSFARSSANHPEVAAALESTASALRSLGARVIDVTLPNADLGIAAYYIIATAEASSNLARFDGIRYGRRASLSQGQGLRELFDRSRAEGFGPEVRKRIMLGTYVLSAGYYDAYYASAQRARRLIARDYAKVFSPTSAGGDGCHALLLPSSPSPAWTIGEKTSDPLAMYLEDVYTVGVNLAGLPAITVPGGFASVGAATLPIGMQFIGPTGADAQALRLARSYEAVTSHAQRTPPTTVDG
jgi:aspartyl-tRNA(Asn)/glutamyl-tRNA(Gln) amidotransferase subunit A